MNHEIEKLQEKIARLESLIEVTAIISSVLDLEQLLNLVMDKAQSVMHAEASSILLLNETSGILECEIALGEVREQVKEKMKLELGQGIGGWVAQTGKPLIVADVLADARFCSHSDKTTGFKTRSILAVPLKVKDRVIGVAEVLNPIDRPSFSEDDLDLFVTFSRQVALAIENARMHRHLLEKEKLEQQLEAAYSIQQSFMPQGFPQSPDNSFSLCAKNLPAKSIGGDFFDFIEFGDKRQLGIIIGDVSGKGIPAALYMARLVSDFRFYSHLEDTTFSCLEIINNTLVQRSRRGMFVTVQYIQVDVETGKINITNGGHLPIIWYHHNTQIAQVVENINGIPLGIVKDVKFASSEIQLQAGDFLILFTDGVIEAKNRRGSQYSMNRLVEKLNTPWHNPAELIDYILADILRFAEGMPQHDDITIVAFKWR